MAITTSPARALDAAPARTGNVTRRLPSVPSTRTVPSLRAALRDIRRLGGTVTSDTRTVPGIGTWVFIAEADGVEVVIWQDAVATV